MPVNLNLVERLGRALLPPRCLVCGGAGTAARDLCAGCLAELPWNTPACRRCALPLPEAGICGACLRSPPPFEYGLAPLRYLAPVDRLLPHFKFHGGLAQGRLLADLLRERVPPDFLAGIQALVPLPLHRQRLGQRGYNQALELARPLARAWSLPLDLRALRRTRATAAQSELDAAARRRNVRGAFAAMPQTGRRLMLIDDVVTTGATVREAAQALMEAGAAEVRVLAVARAPLPNAAG